MFDVKNPKTGWIFCGLVFIVALVLIVGLNHYYTTKVKAKELEMASAVKEAFQKGRVDGYNEAQSRSNTTVQKQKQAPREDLPSGDLVQPEEDVLGPQRIQGQQKPQKDMKREIASSGDVDAYLRAGNKPPAQKPIVGQSMAENHQNMNRQAKKLLAQKSSKLPDAFDAFEAGESGAMAPYEPQKQSVGDMTTTPQKSSFLVPIDEDYFNANIFSGAQNAMVLIYSKDCKSCHIVMPEFELAAQKYDEYHKGEGDLVWCKMDANEGVGVCRKLGITQIPAIFRFSGDSGPSAVYDLSIIPEEKKLDYRTAKSFFEFAHGLF